WTGSPLNLSATQNPTRATDVRCAVVQRVQRAAWLTAPAAQACSRVLAHGPILPRAPEEVQARRPASRSHNSPRQSAVDRFRRQARLESQVGRVCSGDLAAPSFRCGT